MTDKAVSYPNEGHGHVFERPDGLKAKCGGPKICMDCARDLACRIVDESKAIDAAREQDRARAAAPQAAVGLSDRTLDVMHSVRLSLGMANPGAEWVAANFEPFLLGTLRAMERALRRISPASKPEAPTSEQLASMRAAEDADQAHLLEKFGPMAAGMPRDSDQRAESKPEAPAGLPTTQEPKYTVSSTHIVNRHTGYPVPHDEPVFIFRARDALGVLALNAYLALIGERKPASDHADAVRRRVADFERFAADHPDRMKWPDTAAPANEGGEQPTTLCGCCDGSGSFIAVTGHLGPDDYEYEDECTACWGTGSSDIRDAINALSYQPHSVTPARQMVFRGDVLRIIEARAALAAPAQGAAVPDAGDETEGDEPLKENSDRYVYLRDVHIGDAPENINLAAGPLPGLGSAIDAAIERDSNARNS